MAIRLITGSLQQRSRYCAKQQQFTEKFSVNFFNNNNNNNNNNNITKKASESVSHASRTICLSRGAECVVVSMCGFACVVAYVWFL